MNQKTIYRLLYFKDINFIRKKIQFQRFINIITLTLLHFFIKKNQY
jgi:hypothetical protein